MKILLDENLPIDFKKEFEDESYGVFTVRDLEWDGKKNGELLKLLIENDFGILITLDKNLEKQQNLSKYSVSVLVLNAINNKIQTLKPFVPKIKEAIKTQLKLGVTKINI